MLRTSKGLLMTDSRWTVSRKVMLMTHSQETCMCFLYKLRLTNSCVRNFGNKHMAVQSELSVSVTCFVAYSLLKVELCSGLMPDAFTRKTFIRFVSFLYQLTRTVSVTVCHQHSQHQHSPGQLSLAIPPRVGKMSTGDDYGHRQGRNGEFCVTVGPVPGLLTY